MKTATRNLIVANALWIVGITALLFVMVGGAIAQISTSQDVVHALEIEMDAQQRELDLYPDPSTFIAELAVLDETLAECHRMAASQAVRIAAISASAHKAGVTIVEMESHEPKRIDRDQALSCTHRLVGTGNYQQLAEFLESVAIISELNSIDEVELSREADSSDGTLRASFFVTWFAPGPQAGLASEEQDV